MYDYSFTLLFDYILNILNEISFNNGIILTL